MKNSLFLSLATLLIFTLSINNAFSQQNKSRNSRISSEQLDKLRNRAQNDTKFRTQLMGGRKASTKALASVIGPAMALRYRVFIGSKDGGNTNAETQETTAKMISSFQIELPVIALHLNIPIQQNGLHYNGDVANAFCLAEDQGVGNSWVCTDEEVEITKTGTIRGYSSKKN